MKKMVGKRIRLDQTDLEILSELKKDARASYKAIGESVKMSRPAVRERIQRMEEAGVISGYHVTVNLDELGRGIHVMVTFKFNSDMNFREKPNDVLIRFLKGVPEIIQYWEIYGELDFLIEAAFASKDELHRFLDDLRRFGFVRSHLIAGHTKDEKVKFPSKEADE